MKKEKKSRNLSQILKLLVIKAITESSKSLNMLTDFPESLILSKNDKVGFKITNYINGSQIAPQAFPEPYLTIYKDDIFIRSASELDECSLIRPARSLEITALCKKDGKKDGKDIFSVIQYSPSTGKVFVRYDSSDGMEGLECISINSFKDYFFLNCIKRQQTSNVYDLVVLGFEFKRTLVNEVEKVELLKMGSLTFPNYYNGDKSLFNPRSFHIKCTVDTGPTEVDLRCLSYLSKIENFGKTMWFEFVSSTKKMNLISNLDSAFPQGVNRIRFVEDDWIYYQKYNENNIIPCNLKNNLIDCQPSLTFPVDKNIIKKWAFKRNLYGESNKNSNSNLFLLTKDILEICEINKVPWTTQKQNLNCEKISLKVKEEVIQNLNYDYIYITESQSSLLASLTDSVKKDSTVGYMMVDIPTKLTKFVNLTDFQVSEVLFLNISYYYTFRKNSINLYQRSLDKIIMAPPLYSKNQSVMLSASPASFSTEYGNAKQFILKTNIFSMENVHDNLNWDEIKETVVYNNAWYNLGFNSKVIQGNMADVKVEIDELKIPFKKTLWRETETIAGGDALDDIDIKGLFAISGFGNSHFQVMDEDGKFITDLDFENIFLVFMNFKNKVRVLECRIQVEQTTEDSGDNRNIFKMSGMLKGNDEINEFKKYWLNGKNTCRKVYNFTLDNGELYGGESDGENLYLMFSHSIIDEKSKEKREEMRIMKINKKFKKSGEDLVLSPFKSNCDLQIFSNYLYSICSYSKKSGKLVADKETKYPIYGIIIGQYESHDDVFKLTRTTFVNPVEHGSPFFEKGDTLFIAGTEKKGLVVNNHVNDPSLLVIDFSGINNGIPSYISDKIVIREELTKREKETDKLDIKICPTLSSIFLFSKENSNIYGINQNSLHGTYVTVPINEKEGQTREILKMICSNSDESFQLWVREKFTQKNFLLSYFGFSGLRGSKKLHSELEIKGKIDDIVMTSLLKSRDGVLFSLIYEKSSLFSNKTYISDLRGPMVSFNTADLNKGNYPVGVELTNSGNKKTYQFNLKVIDTQKLTILRKPEPNYPKDFVTGQEVNFSDFVDIKGDLFDLDFSDEEKEKLKGVVEIKKPVEKIKQENTFKIPVGHKFWNSKNGYTMFSLSQTIFINKNWVTPWTKIELKDYGQFCREFDLMQTQKSIIVTVICTVDMEEYLFVVKTQPSSPDGSKFTLLKRIPIDFEAKMVKMIGKEDSVIIAILEKIGSRLTIWKVDVEELNPKDVYIKLKWRRSGNNNLFSYCKFYLMSLKKNYALIILTPGRNNFDLMILDFEIGSVKSIIQVHGENNLPFYFLRCGNGNDEVTLTLKNEENEKIRCIGGGVGIMFYELEIDVLASNGKITAKTVNTYRFPNLKQYNIIMVDSHSDFFLVKGDFGDYKIGKEEVIGGKNKDKVRRLTGILYKRGIEKPMGYAPYGNNVVDLEYFNGYNVLVSIHKTEGAQDEICIQKIYLGDYKLKILDGKAFTSDHDSRKINFIAMNSGLDSPSNQVLFDIRFTKPINFGALFYWILVLACLGVIIYICYITFSLSQEKKLNRMKRIAETQKFINDNTVKNDNPIAGIFGGIGKTNKGLGDSYQSVSEETFEDNLDEDYDGLL